MNMSAFDFPTSPTVNQKYPQPPVVGQPVYTWDGEKWLITDLSGKTPIYTDGSTAMAAQLTIQNPPVNPTDAAAKAYVDSKTVLATVLDYLGNAANKLLTPAIIWGAAAPQGIVGTPFTPDLNTAIDFIWTLNGPNCQINNPSNLKGGMKGLIYVVQDATGGRTITTWGTAYKFTLGVKPILSTSPGAIDIISYACGGTPASPVMYCFFTPNFS
jgi:hypothetical protein